VRLIMHRTWLAWSRFIHQMQVRARTDVQTLKLRHQLNATQRINPNLLPRTAQVEFNPIVHTLQVRFGLRCCQRKRVPLSLLFSSSVAAAATAAVAVVVVAAAAGAVVVVVVVAAAGAGAVVVVVVVDVVVCSCAGPIARHVMV
jgi:hypothetical protein